MEDYLIVALDGTSYFNSDKVHCNACCEKHHRDGTITYYHQMLAGVIVHPEHKTVFPLMLEPIIKQDGVSKNDCEHTAAKRLVEKLRKVYRSAKIIVVLDALYADGPMLQLLTKLNLKFIVTAKTSDLRFLFYQLDKTKKQTLTVATAELSSAFEFANNLALNEANLDFKVDVLQLLEQDKKHPTTNPKKFCWLTNLAVTEHTAHKIAKAARARWRIENETFNTLKNQGYQFKHNFGHGKKHLNVVLAYLMFLAFLIDEMQQFLSKRFDAALKLYDSFTFLWFKLRSIFFIFRIKRWSDVFACLLLETSEPELSDYIFDTS